MARQYVHEKVLNITNHSENAKPNNSEILPHTCEDSKYQKHEITSVGKDMKTGEPWQTIFRSAAGNAKLLLRTTGD